MLRKIILVIKKFFMGEKDTSSSLPDEYYKLEIEKKERSLQLFHKIVGDNPLKHIDWIIENGYEEFNKWFKSYEDGSIGKIKSTPSFEIGDIITTKTPQKRCYTYDESENGFKEHLVGSMTYGYIRGRKEEKEVDTLLRQSLNAKDYRLISPANQIKVEVELRAGIGNKVVARYEESSPYGDMFS